MDQQNPPGHEGARRPDAMLTLKEAAAQIGCGEDWIVAQIKAYPTYDGLPTHIRVEQRIMFRRADLDRLLHTAAPGYVPPEAPARTGPDGLRLIDTEALTHQAELIRRVVFGDRGFSTFEAAAQSYLDKEKRSETTTRNVDRLALFFGSIPLKDIDQNEVDRAYRAILTPSAGGATRLRAVLTPLKAVMRHAAVRGMCDLPAFEAPKTGGKPSTNFLLPAQATALVQAAAPHLRPLLVFLIGTGCRMSEALDLQWSKVDLKGGRATVWQKQKNDRHIDLPPVVLASLSALSHREGFVFRPPARRVKGKNHQRPRYADMGREGGGQISTAWSTACQRAGIPGRWVQTARPKDRYWQPELRVHDLRHSWASAHYAMHKDPLKLMVEGGWSTLAMTTRYAHLLAPIYADEWRAWLAGPAP